MTLVLVGWLALFSGVYRFAFKKKVMWALGMYKYIYIYCIYTNDLGSPPTPRMLARHHEERFILSSKSKVFKNLHFPINYWADLVDPFCIFCMTYILYRIFDSLTYIPSGKLT